MLWPTATFPTGPDHELSQPAPNQEGIDRLMGLIEEVVELYGEVNETSKTSIRRCLNLGSRLGLRIQSDLRPWVLGFCLRGNLQNLPVLDEVTPLPQEMRERLSTHHDEL
jgi:hypothetical protein